MTDPSHTEQAAQPGLRERFEAWARRRPGYLDWVLEIADNGTYLSGTAQGLWEAWQASAASPPETPVPQSEPRWLLRARDRLATNEERIKTGSDIHLLEMAERDYTALAAAHALLAASPPETPVPQSEPVARVVPGYDGKGKEIHPIDGAVLPRVGTLLYAAPPSSDGREPKEQT